MMAFVDVEDLFGEFNIIVFPKTYMQYREALKVDNIVKVEGRINIREDEITIATTKIETFTLTNDNMLPENKNLIIKIPQDMNEEELKSLREFIKTISNQKGNKKVTIDNNGNCKNFDMFIDEQIINELKDKVGENNIIWN